MVDLGQVFTKNIVADYMTSLFDLNRNAKILDPCFGGGAFIDSLMQRKYINITGCELDKNLYVDAANKYKNCNILNKDFLCYEDESLFDGIIMNPPYIRQEKIDNLECFGITKKKLRNNELYCDLPSTANIYMYFIVKAISLLRNRGQLIVIFPSSWMNAKNGSNFKKYITQKCGITKKVFIYGDVFEKQALVDVVILKLEKDISLEEPEPEYLEVKDGKLVKKSIDKHISFELFETNFQELASIKRGITTGCNEMFINPEIESENAIDYIISSPKSIEGYSTEGAFLDKLLSVPGESITDEVSDYLKKWKDIIISKKKPKSLYQKIEKNQCWYDIRKIPSKGLVFAYFVRNDMKFVMNNSDVLIRDNFYIIYPHIDKYLMFALLNNFYTYYQLELNGKKYGAGLLKLQRYDLENLMFPNPNYIEDSDVYKLKNLSKRIIKDSTAELIKEITMIISKYCKVSYDEIENQYYQLKSNRLEVKK